MDFMKFDTADFLKLSVQTLYTTETALEGLNVYLPTAKVS